MRVNSSIHPREPIEIFGSSFLYGTQAPFPANEDLLNNWEVRQRLNEPHRQIKEERFRRQQEESPPVRGQEKEPEPESGAADHVLEHMQNPTNPHPLKEAEAKSSKVISTLNRELYRLKAVFPFDLFPDEIKIKENKIIIIQRSFFGSGEIRSFDPQELAEVSLMDTPFFAGMRFNVRSFTNNMLVVRFLKKHEARVARSLIEGLASMIEHKVNTADMSIEEIKHRAMSIGGGKQYA